MTKDQRRTVNEVRHRLSAWAEGEIFASRVIGCPDVEAHTNRAENYLALEAALAAVVGGRPDDGR